MSNLLNPNAMIFVLKRGCVVDLQYMHTRLNLKLGLEQTKQPQPHSNDAKNAWMC
jgi:hypothetical protein